MKAIKARPIRALPHGAWIDVCDNSGAKKIKMISVKNLKTTRNRMPAARVGDLIMASVVSGDPGIRKTVVMAIIVRQKKEYRRYNGTRIKFEDNAAIIVKDEKGNPKGTILKGAIAKEATERWAPISKIATIII